MNDMQKMVANLANLKFNADELMSTFQVHGEVQRFLEEGQLVSETAAATIASWYMTSRKGDLLTAIAHGREFDAFEAMQQIKLEIALVQVTSTDKADLAALGATIMHSLASKIIDEEL